MVQVVRQDALRRALTEARAVLQQDDAERTSLTELTPREREVLVLLTQGHTDKEIADILHIAGHTAVNHVAAIRRKLGVPTRASAVAVALGSGVP
jgi:DNA-binding CsgD family transcriptional regulator